MRRILLLSVVVALLVLGLAPGAMAGNGPTCGGEIGDNHGQHIFGDYVACIGHDFDWPPAGQANASGGAAAPGAAGAHGHIPAGIAPGASFCVSQSQSPGLHP